ncbi:MAG: 3-deoxy-7-phosphoheptulonate synthase, partial [Planctomycetota bacterium]
MLIILQNDCTEAQRRHVIDTVRRGGCHVETTREAGHTILTVHGDLDRLREVPFKVFSGVRQIVQITPAYTLASLEHQPDPTVVDVGGVRIGGGGFIVIGGPCAVEDLGTLRSIARAVKDAGGHLLRGGAWKPRTSPYSFRGLGLDGLKMLREVSQEFGLPTVTEVMDPRHIEAVMSNADMFQVGTRNMSNFELLVE